MQGVSRVRGTKDHFGRSSAILRRLLTLFEKHARLYGYCDELITPNLERRDLFHHSLGQDSEVISKELFELSERNPEEGKKGGNDIVLRPEGTASTMRALWELDQLGGQRKLYYSGPMYRYERPQKGRQREFWQFGVEAVNTESPWSVGEGVMMANDIMNDIKEWQREASGVELECTLFLNSIGDRESRAHYSSVLRDYLHAVYGDLSSLSQRRLDRGSVLRILDSKEEEDLDIIRSSDFPRLSHHLSDKSREKFERFCAMLDTVGVPYIVDDRLVRGLDYYEETVFEYSWTPKETARKNHLALIAGGQYSFDAAPRQRTRGFGWAGGISRLVALLEPEESTLQLGMPPVVGMVMLSGVLDSPEDEAAVTRLVWELRHCGVHVTACSKPTASARNQIGKLTSTLGATMLLFVGQDEVRRGSVSIRHVERYARACSLPFTPSSRDGWRKGSC